MTSLIGFTQQRKMTNMSKRYAKFLPDGTLYIASSVVKINGQTFYHPSDRTLELLGFLELIEVTGQAAEREGYKAVDQGMHVETLANGKKIITNAIKYLKIVDNPPTLSEGLYIRNDYWKEIGDKYVHVYDVASSKRHSKHRNKNKEEKEDEAPKEEPAPSASKFEERIAAEENSDQPTEE